LSPAQSPPLVKIPIRFGINNSFSRNCYPNVISFVINSARRLTIFISSC
jgi:hypothetical protein